MYEIIKGDVRIELVCIGEGNFGEYNPEDPDDVLLMRYYVQTKAGDEWEDVDDGSYCTLLPESANAWERESILNLLMDQLYEPVLAGTHKKVAERLSWVGLHSIDYRGERG